MATFNVDISEVIFAGGNTGYKDITITGMPQGGVTCSITGTDANSFGYRIPGADQNVYRVYTTGTNSGNNAHTNNATFNIVNSENVADSISIMMWQLKSDYVDLAASKKGTVVDVTTNSSTMINTKKDWNSFNWDYSSVFFNNNNGGDYSAHCTVYLDGTYTIPTSGSLPNWISVTAETALTDTGFKKVYVTVTNNYEGPRQEIVEFGNNRYCNIKVYQDGYPSSASGCTETLNVPKNGGTFTTTVKHPSISDNFYPHTYTTDLYYAYGPDAQYNVVRTSKTTNESTFSITLPTNTTGEEIRTFVYYINNVVNNAIVVLGHTTIIQAGDSPTQTLTVDPQTLSYPSSGGGRTLDVTYATSLSTNISSFPAWLSGTYVSVAQGSGQYTITAATNESTASRNFDFELADANMSLVVPITQAGGSGPASMSISPSSDSVTSASGSVQVTVTTVNISSVSYTISDTSWITYGGKAGDVYTFNYSANTSTSSRTGTVTFTGGGLSRTYTLTQAGDTSLVVSPSSMNGRPAGTWIDITVTGSTSRPSYSISDSWITYGSGSTSGYTYTYRFQVAQYFGREDRSATITFTSGGKTGVFTYNQRAAVQMSASPASLSFINTSETKNVDITYEYGFYGDVGQYGDLSYPAWISMSKISSSGSRPYTDTYSVTAATNTGEARSGYIECSDYYTSLSIPVTQAVGASLTISPSSGSVSKGSGSVQITVTKEGIGSVSYSISGNWISYGGKTGDVYTFNYEANGNTSARTGTVTFSGGGLSRTYTLTQAAADYGDIVVSPTSLEFTKDGGEKSVSVTYTGGWFYTSNIPDWISEVSYTHPGSPKTIYVTASANTTEYSRQWYMHLYNDYSSVYVPIIQNGTAGRVLWLSPSSGTVGSDSGRFSVTVSASGIRASDIHYSITSGSDWLSYDSKSNYTFYFTYDANTSYRRTGTITFSGMGRSVTYVVYQNGIILPLSAYPSRLRYYCEGGDMTVSFKGVPTNGISYTVTYTDGSGWLSVTGSGKTRTVTATENEGIRRRATIRFYETGYNQNYVDVTVIQGSSDYYESIWVDELFYPQGVGYDNEYYYRIVNASSGTNYFTGMAVQPAGWTGNIGGIDVPRLVEDYLSSVFFKASDFTGMGNGYRTVNIYNMTETGYPGVLDATYKYWNDWSRVEKRYDYTRSLNDPINGRGCDDMIIPFCVYYDDAATFSLIETEMDGNVNTYTFSTPSYPFLMSTGEFYNTKTLVYKQDDEVLFTYDMTCCGKGALIYRNRFGAFDSFLIEGNIIKTDNYTRQNYTIKGEYSNSGISINRLNYINEKKTDSNNINETYEVHTGWLSDDESERLVYHLLSSPVVYFQDLDIENRLYDKDSSLMPVRLTGSSSEYKKFRNGRRLVSYTITFEKANTEKVRN